MPRPLRARTLLPLALFLGGLAGWLLWPLESPRFRITTDADKLWRKQSFLVEQARQTQPARGPNIIVILADDLGKTDLPLYDSGLI